MFIETEDTPNPATLKFLPGRAVMGDSGTIDFIDADAVIGRSVLADALFALPGVSRVFLGHDFVSVTKADSADWSELRPIILSALVDHFAAGVRPAVAGDGGDIVFRGYKDGIVRLTMQGACSGCPSSRATLKHGVENMLRHYVPEVVGVEQVEG